MMTRRLLTPRDWQSMALRNAADNLGTSEGAALLAEAKRYGALADEIERMARRIDALTLALVSARSAIKTPWPWKEDSVAAIDAVLQAEMC